MGVPKFAAWLTKKYPAMITRNCPADVHGLYIDLNGLIHPCCHDEDDPSVAARPEAEKIRQVCLAIETLVTSTKPRHVVYIATDGVAPRAKMNQQRARRYMKAATQMDSVDALGNVEGGTADAAQQEEVERDLAEVNAALQADTLYGSSGEKEAVAVSSPLLPGSDDLLQDMKTAPVYRQQPASSSAVEDDSKFDSNCISPGTEFMAKVAVAVREWVEAKLSVDEDDNDAAQGLWSGLTVVISDANTPGEGEHKLLDFLRTQASFSGFNGHGAHVVAGLDADLIFLTLSLHIPRVFILRDQKRPSSFDRRRGKGGRKKNDNNKKQKHVDPSEESPAERDASSQPASESDDAEEQIITTTVEACRSYEYFDIDCVGSSIVSEISTLCGLKGFGMKCDPRHYGELIASGGYNFDRVAGKADGELKSTYIPKRPKQQRNTETTAAPMGDSGSNTDHAIKKEEGNKKETHNSEAWNPCTDVSNSKIIDDFIVMAMIMGNDFIPRVPSAFCGESAMDNIMEMYVGEVLPYGYLTLGFQEINLIQLQRFFAAYAKIEAVKFRQHCIKQGGMTGPEAAAPIGAAIDSRWRKPYYDSVSIHPTKIHDACRAYVEGLRFVWRYYSTTSAAVSWSWYYPYHHGPFAADVAQFLQQQGPSVQTALPPPKLETTPPDPTTQLLCILPPTSSKLLPEVFREVMANPPEALADTFPKRWNVDYAAAFNKEHLAAVMLPFASMDGLRALVKDRSAQLSAEEQSRTRTIHFHVVLKKKQQLKSAGEEESESDNTRSAPYAFKILGEGLRPLTADDVDWAFVDSTRADARVEYWALAETEPQLCRPRTYSPNVAISNLSVLPDGRILRQKRASARNDPHGKSGYDKKPPAAAATSVDAARGNQKPVLIELLICAAVVAVLTAAALTPLTNCLIKMQFLAVFVTAACMAYVLGIASGGYKKGSGLQRNAIRMTYVDWQCSSCLSLNFSKNNRCFVCSAPFDATRSWALFSGRMPADPPLMEPDHRPHVVTFGLP